MNGYKIPHTIKTSKLKLIRIQKHINNSNLQNVPAYL